MRPQWKGEAAEAKSGGVGRGKPLPREATIRVFPSKLFMDFQKPKDPRPENRETPSEQVAKATVQQQGALWMFGIIAGASVLFGVLQIRQNLKAPFIPKADTNENTSISLSNNDLNKLSDLQNKDTDADGLSDYDELYSYDTSPYLQDSDSDGLKDKEELQSGGNPNCPEGELCSEPTETNNTNKSADTNSGTTSGADNTGDDSASTLATAPVPPATIRQILKNAGAPAEAVDGLDDNELIKLYNETVKQTGLSVDSSGNATNGNGNTNAELSSPEQAALLYDDLQGGSNPLDSLNSAGTQDLQKLQNLTAPEIRALLVKIGGDEKLISSIDDATIKAIFLQAITQFSETGASASN